MHITVDTQALKNSLELVGRVSTKHVTLPVLQCVVLSVEDTHLLLKATNLEIAVEVKIALKSNEGMQVAIPATLFLQTIALIEEPEVQLYIEGDVLVVETKKAKTNLKTFEYDEFPKIPHVESVAQTINGKLFATGIKTTAFASSQSSIKPELGSVYVHQKKEHSLTFVATDSFRLIERTVAQKNVVLDEPLLIPQKNALEIARVLEQVGGDPEMTRNDNQCAFQFPDTYITSRLTNGTFPDYAQIIPKEYVTHTTILKQDLIHTFKRSQVFLNRFQQVQLHVTDTNLTVTAHNGDVGTTTETIRATTEGEELSLKFNQRYVSEVLPFFSEESITLHFAGIGRPLVITGVNDQSTRYLVMPMNK